MLLTDNEIKSKYETLSWFRSDCVSHEDAIEFARAIETAILAKLAGAELPEPSVIGKHKSSGLSETGYTADQLRQAYAQGAASQLSAEPVGHFDFIEFSQIWEESHALAGTPLYTRKEPK